jgi:hypothetical protein
MKKTIYLAVALVFTLSACGTTMEAQTRKEKDCDKDDVVVTVIAGNNGVKLISVSQEPVYVCTARKITWVIDKDQDTAYEFRGNSIVINDAAGTFANCKGNIDGELDGKNKIKCDDRKTAQGGPWKYTVRVFPVGSPANDPGVAVDPTIFNN